MNVTSLELSNKLLVAGFKADTDFVWNQGVRGDPDTYYLAYHTESTPHRWELINPIPAYDLETLLRFINKNQKFFCSVVLTSTSQPRFNCGDYDRKIVCSRKETLANGAARLLITLIKNKSIKIHDRKE